MRETKMGMLCEGEEDGMGLRWLWREKYQAGGEGLERLVSKRRKISRVGGASLVRFRVMFAPLFFVFFFQIPPPLLCVL